MELLLIRAENMNRVLSKNEQNRMLRMYDIELGK